MLKINGLKQSIDLSNDNGKLWYPNKYSVVCSAHFIGDSVGTQVTSSTGFYDNNLKCSLDKSCGPDSNTNNFCPSDLDCDKFHGFDSVKNETSLKDLTRTSFNGFLFSIPPEELFKRMRIRGVTTITVTTSSTMTIITTKAKSTITTHSTTITATATTITTFKCVKIKPAVITTSTKESVIPSSTDEKSSKTTKTTTIISTTTTTNIDPVPKISTSIMNTKTHLPSHDTFLEIMVKVLKPQNP
ncbi:hypothetical protein QTP88_001308 [Uroleucon formosanum]